MLLCLQYSKGEEVRFLSHLDLMRAMERALRRARLPLAFSEGYNPHPRLSYASALAVGVTSGGEYLDLELEKDLPAQEVEVRLNLVLPPGLKVLAAVPVRKRKKSLMALINLARYQVLIFPFRILEQEDVEEMIAQVLSCSTYVVTRQGKRGVRQVDIRPGLFHLQGQLVNHKLILQMDVLTGSSGNVRPEEVVEMIKKTIPFSGEEIVQIHRVGLYIREKDKIYSPLEKA
ncbi:MAG: TIGR03936 family radical SAM-associated protein [Clostridia bacterium]|nr:TIGR03936 family radical SAM-associated protein [Clostridia bacterium]